MAYLVGDLRCLGGKLLYRGEWAASEAAYDDEEGVVSGFTYTMERAPASGAAEDTAAAVDGASAEEGAPTVAWASGSWIASGGFQIQGDDGEVSMIVESDLKITIAAEGSDVTLSGAGANAYGEFELTGSVDEEMTATCSKTYLGGDGSSEDDSDDYGDEGDDETTLAAQGDDGVDAEEEARLLAEEAELPIEEVIRRYKARAAAEAAAEVAEAEPDAKRRKVSEE